MKREVQFPEQFESLLRHSSDAVLIVDPDRLTILAANQHAADCLGQSINKLRDASLRPRLSRPALDHVTAARHRGAGHPVEPAIAADLIRIDGHRTTAQIKAALDRTGHDRYLVVTARNLAHSERAWTRHRRTEHLNHVLLQDPNSFNWSANASLTFTHVSASARNVIGFSDDELIGLPISNVLTQRSAAELSSVISKPLRTVADGDERESHAIELEFLHRDGRVVLTDTVLSISRQANGTHTGLIGLARDASTRQRAWVHREAALMNALERRKQQSLNEFAVRFGDHMHGSFESILALAAALEDGLDYTSREQHYVDRIVRTARQATSVLRELRRYGGLHTPDTMPISLNRLLTGLGGLMREIVPKSITPHFELGEELPEFEADPAQVQEAILHLIRNATDALEDRGGMITVRTSHVCIAPEDLSGFVAGAPLRSGEYVFVDVIDDGPGIDPSSSARLFEPFYTRNAKKRGLGLSAVLGVVRAHEGAVQLLSSPGHGARFRLLFPAIEERKPAFPVSETNLPESELDTACTGRVAIVSSDSNVERVSTGFFLRKGYQCFAVKNVDAAVRALNNFSSPGDILLLDDDTISPEDHDRIQELEKQGNLPKLIVCYERMPDAVLLADESNSQPAYIPKPVCASDMAEAVKVSGAGLSAIPAAFREDDLPNTYTQL